MIHKTNRNDSLGSITTLVVIVGLLAFSLGACTPADNTVEGTAATPNLTEEITYYQDPRTDVCVGSMFNQSDATFEVECTPKVMALIRGPVTPTPEAVR